MNAPIRIALADDQALVRSGLKALLAGFDTLAVVLEAGDGEALLAAMATTPVDVVLSDIRMPGLDGFGLVQALRERGDATPVVLLTTFDDEALPLRAAAAGAQGFLLKDASPAAKPCWRRCPPTRCARATPTATRPRPATPSANARWPSCGCWPAATRTRRSRARCSCPRAR
jgi:DNA-binding NarL/FixJ family response regulator